MYEELPESMWDLYNNRTTPHALLYCLDRPYHHFTMGGAVFVYSRVTLDVTFTVAVVIANTALIISINRYRKRFRGTAKVYNSGTSMKFVQFLAVSDLLVGLSLPVYMVPHYLCDINDVMRSNRAVCVSKFVLYLFCMCMTNFSILSIAVDRYLAVECSLKYRLIMTHRKCHAIILGLSLCAGAICIVPLFWNNWTPASYCDIDDILPVDYVVTVAVPLHIAIIVVVGGVHFKLHRKAAESADRRSTIMEGQPIQRTPCHIKSAKVVVLVTGVYLVCWTPFSILSWLRILQHQPSASPLLDFLLQAFVPFSYANSLINPFIYAWKNTEIKNALKWSLFRRTWSTSFGSRAACIKL